MTGEYYLDWTILAVSLFNTILLLWLGLTVLLNAERRAWGIWIAGIGLLMGGIFFTSHTAILGSSLRYTGPSIAFFWSVGLLAVSTLPFAWYIVILWYTGFWDDDQSDLHRRQSVWFYLSFLLTVGFVSLLLFSNPLTAYPQVLNLNLSPEIEPSGLQMFLLAYPLYVVIVIGLSLDALRRPGPSKRMMGDLARRRARPWLVATSGVLLLVGVLIAGVIFWFLANDLRVIYQIKVLTIGWFDLVISGLIAIADILLGQAIVHYEVFTGKTLPRHGFMRHWRNAIILAAGYCLLMGWGLVSGAHPIYSILLTALLMTGLYALFSWRSYSQRERYIQNLRPFVVSHRLYEHLTTDSTALPADVNVSSPFYALCVDVLDAKRAYLMAVGPLAPLVPVLAYPSPGADLPPISDLTARFTSPQTMCVLYGASPDPLWAVPLWSERGLIGVLLLGEKADGGLYTQEEIEIARAIGERLIDTEASAEMARRLMALQRQRLAESQVLDRRTRRALHDEVLPRLHSAMLTLSASADPGITEVVETLAGVHRQIADMLHELPAKVAPEITRLGLVPALKAVIEDELGSAFEAVNWQVDPRAESEALALPPLTAEVVYYAAREAIRNAARYGRGDDSSRPLHLKIGVGWCDGLQICVEDDGIGLANAAKTNRESGHGLALHSTMMAVAGGSLATDSLPGRYTRVLLTLPPVHR